MDLTKINALQNYFNQDDAYQTGNYMSKLIIELLEYGVKYVQN